MERNLEPDTTPSEEWLNSLNATCNRLSTQYRNLLQSSTDLQVQVAAEQLAVAAAHILTLIRTLRVSKLVMERGEQPAPETMEKALQLEEKWWMARNNNDSY